jgi:hypothetical protein
MSSLLTFKQYLKEVRYINPNPRNENPIKNTDKIRVFHGFYKLKDAIDVITNGLTGKEIAKRIYSYEHNNNPNGLFVSIDPKIAFKFARSNIVIEFTANINDLEAPVWPGGHYYIPGQKSKSFDNDEERNEEKVRQLNNAKTNMFKPISDSDRPELAQMFFDNPESQALFIGDLDPNMIKRIFVRSNNEIKKYTIDSFKKIFKKYFNEYPEKTLFHPTENFSLEELFKRLKYNKDDFKIYTDMVKRHYDSDMEMKQYGFFHKQNQQIKDLVDSNKFEQQVSEILNKG